METKWLEIRDDGTRIPVFAFTTAQFYEPKDTALIRHAGLQIGAHHLIVGRFHPSAMNVDAYEWRSRGIRTMFEAHIWLAEHWTEVKNGDVIDVEFILGETARPKTSDFQ